VSWVDRRVYTSVRQKEGEGEGERERACFENITIYWACTDITICISLLHFRLFFSTSFYTGVLLF